MKLPAVRLGGQGIQAKANKIAEQRSCRTLDGIVKPLLTPKAVVSDYHPHQSSRDHADKGRGRAHVFGAF